MSADQIIIDAYLKAWGAFMRKDRGCKGYFSLDWDFTGENPTTIEDVVLERTIGAMQQLRGSKPDTYSVLYVIYVDEVDIKKAGKHLDISRRRAADLKLDGIIFLSGFLLGAEHIAAPQVLGKIQHWGEYPTGDIEAPRMMRAKA